MMMNKYDIKEINSECTYLELRILSYLECEAKMKKITEILNFLARNNFLVNLTRVYYYPVKSEFYSEKYDVQSLTIDLQDDKFRFKYWDGATTYWTYHTQDLFKILIKGRNDFDSLVSKYKPITDLLFDIKEEKTGVIKWVRYKYYPEEDVDILYELEFRKHVEGTDILDNVLNYIHNRINDLGLKDLNMTIDYSFDTECLPCQKAKEAQNAD